MLSALLGRGLSALVEAPFVAGIAFAAVIVCTARVCIQTLRTEANGATQQGNIVEVSTNCQVPAHENQEAATDSAHVRLCSGWPRRNLVRAPLALTGHYVADAVSSVAAGKKASRSGENRGLGLALKFACGVALSSVSGSVFAAIARGSGECAPSVTTELSTLLSAKVLANVMVLAACLFTNNANAPALAIRLLELVVVAIGVLSFATKEWGCQLNLVQSALVSCIISAWKPVVFARATNSAVQLLCTHPERILQLNPAAHDSAIAVHV